MCLPSNLGVLEGDKGKGKERKRKKSNCGVERNREVKHRRNHTVKGDTGKTSRADGERY